ncbi:MAG: chromosomal replication initiator protein DnaA [Clostridiales bacterium]|nr:chromosomal replication initiator protein DnaA [Clostridiales bacterium]
MDKIWSKVLDIISTEIKQSSFENFFSAATILDVRQDGAIVKILVSDDYTQSYMADSYTSLLEKAFFTVTGQRLTVVFLEEDSQKDQTTPTAPLSARPQAAQLPPLFNPRYIFDTFVVGNSNRFAHAAAIAVSEHPSRTYNPLFIYGGSGLGKTHLMHAIGQAVLRNRPQKKVAYVSTETFTNEFISLVRTGKAHNFKNRYRYTDIFLIDDIQFLTGKEGTQEEFFFTFNALHEAGKQIVISSDRPPKEIETLEERLRSRFEGGLITDIQAPDFETRCAILQNKASGERVTISEELIFFIATKIHSNIRELEGALNKIIYHAKFYHMDYISMEQGNDLLRGLIPENVQRPRLSIPLIQRVVSEHYHISTEDIKGKKKDHFISHPRQVAMYLCREMIGATQKQIGHSFGGRDHTTFIHAYNKIMRSLNENEKLQQDIEQIKSALMN